MEEVEVEGGGAKILFFLVLGKEIWDRGEGGGRGGGGGEEEEEDGGGSGEVQKQIPMEKHNSKFHTPDQTNI